MVFSSLFSFGVFSDYYLDIIPSLFAFVFMPFFSLQLAIGLHGCEFSEVVSNTQHINNIQFIISQSFTFEFVDIFFCIATNAMYDTLQKRERN